MDIRFDGKRALVTGAGRGIGRCIAKALSKCGAHTIAVARTQADLDSLKQEDPRIQTVSLDITDLSRTREVVSGLGPIHCLVNNAGVFAMAPALESSTEEFDRLLNINVKALMNMSQVVAKGLIEVKSGGSIVHVTSDLSSVASEGCMMFGGTKAAVDQMMKVMALEWGPHQIRVNSVRPIAVLKQGAVEGIDASLTESFSKRIPQRRLPTEEDVMRPVLFLLSDQSDMVNGSTLLVDGGVTGTVEGSC